MPLPHRPVHGLPLSQSTCWVTWNKPRALPRPASTRGLPRRSRTCPVGSLPQFPRAWPPPKSRRRSLAGAESPGCPNRSSPWSSSKARSRQVRGGPGRRGGTRGHVTCHLPPPCGARKLSIAHREVESKPGCFSVNQLLWKIQLTGDTVCTTKRAGCELGQVRPPA